jgi:hypothetical protein
MMSVLTGGAVAIFIHVILNSPNRLKCSTELVNHLMVLK